MDIFNGNKQLANLIFSYLDWGLFMASKGNPNGTPCSFLVLKKDEQYDLHQFFGSSNIMEEAAEILHNTSFDFNQYLISYGIKMKEHESPSVIVIGFDRSLNEGIVFGHSYKINDVGNFVLVGRPFCLGKERNLLPIIESNLEKDEFGGSESIATVQDGEKVKFLIPMNYPNESQLVYRIVEIVLYLLEQDSEPNFNGKIKFSINPAFQKRDDYLLFLLEQKLTPVSQSEQIKVWTDKFDHQELNVTLSVGDKIFYECMLNKAILHTNPNEQNKKLEPNDQPAKEIKSKSRWKFW